MSKIKVHILNSHSLIHSHIEIVLEQESQRGSFYYRINPWRVPKQKATIDNEDCLKALEEASESQIIVIDAEFSELIKAWKDKYNEDSFSCCSNNCADISAWFLETFVNIPNPGSCGSPFSVNYLFCGFFVPSFLQCCTLPGRVFDYAKESQNDEGTGILRL